MACKNIPPENPAPPPVATCRNARDLVTVGEFARVRRTVLGNNPGMTPEMAERITAEGIAFVATAAAYPTTSISPSPVVDEGWHALILHTRLYAKLCASLGGFVHHYPQQPEDGGFDADIIERTLDTMRATGFEPDLELWRGPAEQDIDVTAITWHTPMPGGCGPINPGNCATHGGGGDGE
ncbi:glycine-rich domain-containing protein [Streptomyces sp. NPDC090445]|uniref:glycine-rich domain-containing protein n=1 Tax=Streptomyces sp. NPDC090445 TaxID=3365963 RepID=UPI0037F8FB7B